MKRTSRVLTGISLALLVAIGCQKGPTKFKVTGRILGKDGAPATFSEKTYVTLKFVPEGDGERIGARINNTAGTFEVDLPAGKSTSKVPAVLLMRAPMRSPSPSGTNFKVTYVFSEKVAGAPSLPRMRPVTLNFVGPFWQPMATSSARLMPVKTRLVRFITSHHSPLT